MKHRFLWAVPALVVLVAGCGGDQSAQNTLGGRSPSDAGKPLMVGIVFDSGGRGDKSFNDSAWAGIERAKTSLNVNEVSIESKSEKDYEPNLKAMAEKGCDLVVAVGINMTTALEKVAPDYPNVKFAIVDGLVAKPNVRSLKFKEEEGSFLAGYLAGLMTKTNKIGFVGGMELDLIKKFQYGYEAGAKTANPKVELLAPKYTGSWDNVDNGKAAATALYSDGADIVYHAAGRAGLGVIKAAAERKLYAIGVDSDQDAQAPGYVLTSMIKRVDEAVFQTIKDLKENKFTAETKIYDLKAAGVGLSEMKYTKKAIGDAKLGKVKAIGEKIAKGDVVVPATQAEYEKFAQVGSKP